MIKKIWKYFLFSSRLRKSTKPGYKIQEIKKNGTGKEKREKETLEGKEKGNNGAVRLSKTLNRNCTNPGNSEVSANQKER